MLQEYYRPTIVLGSDGTDGPDYRGSGRSIEGFDLAAALRQCDDLLVRHGGHAMAAGLTVRADQVEGLRTRLNDLARRTLKPEWLQPALRIDAVVGIEEVSLDRVRELSQLEHTGMGNPPVHLVLRGVTHARPLQRVGAEKKHAKLWITDGRQVLDAVPASWLVALQVYRVLGSVFLIGWAGGTVPGIFGLPAGIGDVITGLLALPVAISVAAGTIEGRRAAIAWNTFGLLDFTVAVSIGLVTSPGPLQLIVPSISNAQLGTYPSVLVPAFAVPSSILLHVLSLRQLYRRSRPAETRAAAGAPALA